MLIECSDLLGLNLHKINTIFYLQTNTTDDDWLFLKNYYKNYNRVSEVLGIVFVLRREVYAR